MAKLGDRPLIGDRVTVTECDFGLFVEIGDGTRIAHSSVGDYSYCDRNCDIANATIGKFANIASYARIGPTDHPLETASLHHFLYRSAWYWDDAEDDAAFFEHRRGRRIGIGHDTWIGHNVVIRPEVTIGHGAVIAASAVVTKDVPPYAIVGGLPAKLLRWRQPHDIADRLIALGWWDWEHHRLRAALEDFRSLKAEAFLERYGG